MHIKHLLNRQSCSNKENPLPEGARWTVIERRWQLWRRPDSAAADSPKTLVIVIVVGNTHSAGSANGVSDLVGPLEGEWNSWVLLIGIGIVGHMNCCCWWWWWWCCCNHGIGNIGSFGHIGECRNSRIGMSDHSWLNLRWVIGRSLLLLVLVVVIRGVIHWW